METLQRLLVRLPLDRLWHAVQQWRHQVTAWVAALVLVAVYFWGASVAYAPLRLAGGYVPLDELGYPGVSIKVIHPTYIAPNDSLPGRPITVFARADSAGVGDVTAQPVTLVLPLPDDSLALVDRTGTHVPGRLTLYPGFPVETPQDIWVTYGNTQTGARLVGRHIVRISPAIVTAEGVHSVPALAFSISVDSVGRNLFRRIARVTTPALPLLIGIIALTLWSVSRWQQRRQQVRLAQERLLAGRYAQLRSHIKLEQWESARQEIDAIQAIEPAYRDVSRLDGLVSSAETASWRREQLYTSGIEAYRQRNWPVAAQALATLEEENPYYREVRFLRRTAELYADLASRDRSVRIHAAEQLGQVGDLLDTAPLIEALADSSSEVADAAERAFRQIGPRSADDLIGALKHSRPAVRRRAYRLLQGMGRSVYERLLGGLHSTDPQITRTVARLLADLGALEELAKALLWLEPEHHDGIRRALAHEGAAAVAPLAAVLYEAPPERRQAVINVLAGLLDQEEVQLRVEELLRVERDPRHRALLQRIQHAAEHDAEQTASEPPDERPETPNTPLRWFRRLDKGP
ncbi:MAG: hypothetical protein ABFD20_07935 [Anaerolineales bacterium]